MNNMMRCATLNILLLTICFGEDPSPSLKSAVESNDNLQYFGTEVAYDHLNGDSTYKSKVIEQYNLVTAENACKFYIQYAEGQFNYDKCDYIANWADNKSLAFRFHALIWGVFNPSWLQNNKLSAGSDAMKNIMYNHIQNVVPYYKSKVIAWDVVNEAVKDAGSGDGDSRYLTSSDQSENILKQYAQQENVWVTNPWYQIDGDYVELAYRYTRDFCSGCKLFYNDYNLIQYAPKRNAVFNMIQSLNSEKYKGEYLVNGIGFQAHLKVCEFYGGWRCNSLGLTKDSIQASFEKFANIGLEIHITEIDIANPDNDQDKLAAIYGMVLEACLAVPLCTSFESWGFTDKYTWIGSDNHPLPFEESSEYPPKTAATTMRDILLGSDSSGSGSSGSDSSSGGSIKTYSYRNVYWIQFALYSDHWIQSVEIQGSSWGNTWATCGWETYNDENVWGCSTVDGKTAFGNDLPLNLRITDRDGAVSSSYGVITSMAADQVYYLNSFDSAYTEDDGDAEDSPNAGVIAVIAVLVVIGLGIICFVGYCFGWRKYQRNKAKVIMDEIEEESVEKVEDDEDDRDEIEIDIEKEDNMDTAGTILVSTEKDDGVDPLDE